MLKRIKTLLFCFLIIFSLAIPVTVAHATGQDVAVADSEFPYSVSIDVNGTGQAFSILFIGETDIHLVSPSEQEYSIWDIPAEENELGLSAFLDGDNSSVLLSFSPKSEIGNWTFKSTGVLSITETVIEPPTEEPTTEEPTTEEPTTEEPTTEEPTTEAEESTEDTKETESQSETTSKEETSSDTESTGETSESNETESGESGTEETTPSDEVEIDYSKYINLVTWAIGALIGIIALLVLIRTFKKSKKVREAKKNGTAPTNNTKKQKENKKNKKEKNKKSAKSKEIVVPQDNDNEEDIHHDETNENDDDNAPNTSNDDYEEDDDDYADDYDSGASGLSVDDEISKLLADAHKMYDRAQAKKEAMKIENPVTQETKTEPKTITQEDIDNDDSIQEYSSIQEESEEISESRWDFLLDDDDE